MVLKVLLIDPVETLSQEDYDGRPSCPNLGLAYIYGYLKQQGKSKVYLHEMLPLPRNSNLVVKRIKEIEPDIVGFTAKTFNILAVYKYAKIVKELLPNTLVVLGGIHGTALPEYTLNECKYIDVIVEGEGEIAFSEIVNCFNHTKKFYKNIDGITYRIGDEIARNPNRKIVQDLDTLPLVDYSVYDLKSYASVYNYATKKRELRFSIMMSRGCPFNCSFCFPQNRKIRYRSVDNVIAEIKSLVNNYYMTFFNFDDATFALDKKWVYEFCDKFMRLGFHKRVYWGFETRVEICRDLELLKRVKSANCTYLLLGIESVNEEVLSHANKSYTKDTILSAIANAKNAGIDTVWGNFILGLPFETKNTIKETLDFIQNSRLDYASAGIVDIYPATELYNQVEQCVGGIHWLPNMKNNWASYSRMSCQTEVNDLTVKDLAYYLNQINIKPSIFTWQNLKEAVRNISQNPLMIKKIGTKLIKRCIG